MPDFFDDIVVEYATPDELKTIAAHYYHQSGKEAGNIAYTPDACYGERDRQVIMKPGRYLAKYLSSIPAQVVADAGARLRRELGQEPIKVHWARTREEIRRVYINGPHSCMSHDVSDYYTDGVHPCEVYATPDIGIAYITRDARITGRAVCNLERKSYTRAYGDCPALMDALESEGFTKFGSLDDCRLLRLTNKHDEIIMPYIDGGENSVSELNSTYLIVGEHSGVLGTADSTNGTLNDEEMCTCGDCGDRVREDNMYYVNGMDTYVCENCVETDGDYIYFDGEWNTREYLLQRSIVETADGEWHSLDDCGWCEDEQEWHHIDALAHFTTPSGDIYYTSVCTNVVQDSQTGESIHICDANEYEIDGETCYSLNSPEEDEHYTEEEAA
jgi:hypothetical protein